jgi:RNA polymerase sigma-70 factor (ECF subfamily)
VLAEEATQDAFMALIREPGRYDATQGPVRAYLYGVARNLLLQRIEKDRRYVALEVEHLERTGFLTAEDTEGVAGELERQETVETVRRAVLTLPPGYREVVVLCDLQEMNYEQAAGLIGCAVGTVRSRLHRARALLAAKLRARLKAARPARCMA